MSSQLSEPKKHGSWDDVDERLKAYGLKSEDVEGDGNCQFRALAYQLEGNDENHQTIRTRVYEELKDHKELYEGFCSEPSYDIWMEEVGKGRRILIGNEYKYRPDIPKWGDNLTLQAFANYRKCTVNIVHPACNLFQVTPSIAETKEEIVISYLPELHYRATVPLDDSSDQIYDQKYEIIDLTLPSESRNSINDDTIFNFLKLWKQKFFDEYSNIEEDLNSKKKNSWWMWYVLPNNWKGKRDREDIHLEKNKMEKFLETNLKEIQGSINGFSFFQNWLDFVERISKKNKDWLKDKWDIKRKRDFIDVWGHKINNKVYSEYQIGHFFEKALKYLSKPNESTETELEKIIRKYEPQDRFL